MRLTRTVNIVAGQELTVDFELPSLTRISGRITGEDHKPVAGAQAVLIAREYSMGKLRLAISLFAATNDRGDYFFPAVQPGRDYLVLATVPRKLNAASDDPSDVASRKRVLAPTYYPGSLSPDGAVPIVLAEGEKRESVEIRIVSTPSYCAEGWVVLPEDKAHFKT